MILEQCKGVHCEDLGESFPTSIFLQNFASIQPRTSPVKFEWFGPSPSAHLSTKAPAARSGRRGRRGAERRRRAAVRRRGVGEARPEEAGGVELRVRELWSAKLANSINIAFVSTVNHEIEH